MWVITREINEYDQDGHYFETAFNEKPTVGDIKCFLGCDEDFAKHILNGGGRIKTEHTWYFLTEIKSGEQYTH